MPHSLEDALTTIHQYLLAIIAKQIAKILPDPSLRLWPEEIKTVHRLLQELAPQCHLPPSLQALEYTRKTAYAIWNIALRAHSAVIECHALSSNRWKMHLHFDFDMAGSRTMTLWTTLLRDSGIFADAEIEEQNQFFSWTVITERPIELTDLFLSSLRYSLNRSMGLPYLIDHISTSPTKDHLLQYMAQFAMKKLTQLEMDGADLWPILFSYKIAPVEFLTDWLRKNRDYLEYKKGMWEYHQMAHFLLHSLAKAGQGRAFVQECIDAWKSMDHLKLNAEQLSALLAQSEAAQATQSPS